MSWQNQSGGGNKNPWGRPPGGNGPKNPWGGPPNGGGGGRGGNGGGNEPPPDLDELLRKAQDNLRQIFPGGPAGSGRAVMIAIAAIVVLWLTTCLYFTSPGEHAVIQRFGKWDRTATTAGPGVKMPWPIENVTKVNVSQTRRMVIGFIDSGSASSSAVRDVPDESLMLTSDANIVNLDLVVLWNIKSAESYLFNVQDPESTIKKVAESAIREVVGQTQMLSIITQGRPQVSAKATEIMQQNLDSYDSGVQITDVLIQEAEVHPEVQPAFQDVQSAKQDAIDVQNRAQAYRQDILPKARGEAIQMVQNAQAYRDAVIARANGDATRFTEMLAAYRTGPDVTRSRIYIETMESVMRNAQKVVMDSSASRSGVVPYLPLDGLRQPQQQTQQRPAATAAQGTAQ